MVYGFSIFKISAIVMQQGVEIIFKIQYNNICNSIVAPLKSKNFGGANLRTMKRRAIMTKKQIVNTIGWTVIVFAILASYRYYIGVDNWVEETLNWVIPAAVGYFLGYGQAQKDQRR